MNVWVEELIQNDSCVLFYKQQQVLKNYPQLKSEDFILVLMNEAQIEILNKYGSDILCIDGTHGLNQYDFQLITLLTVDNLRQGYPCAFLISNRCDEEVISIFFSCIKEKIGPIQPNAFR